MPDSEKSIDFGEEPIEPVEPGTTALEQKYSKDNAADHLAED